jgi:hypothetical protein
MLRPPSLQRTTPQVFKILQVVSACAMSFAHGANDTSNAIGACVAGGRLLCQCPALLRRDCMRMPACLATRLCGQI